MNMLKLFCVAILCLSTAGCIEPNKPQQYKNAKKLRAYISTGLALSIMTKPFAPDEEDEAEICDGSGWITHGDGHKTECPGCAACKNKDTESQESKAVDIESEYYVYHFGAKWCGPCERLKSQTWKNKEVKDFLKDRKAKLFIFDADNKEHDKFFDYYKIKSYPTILLVNKQKLSTILYRSVGYKPPSIMIESLGEKIPSSVLEGGKDE